MWFGNSTDILITSDLTSLGPLSSTFLYHLGYAMPNYWSNTFLLGSKLAERQPNTMTRRRSRREKKRGEVEAGLRAPVCLSSSARHWHCSPAA